MKKKICNIFKIIILVLSITSVSAATTYLSSGIYYDNSSSTIMSDDIQNAIDELADKLISEDCPNGYHCDDAAPLQPGDYILYTPTTSTYTIIPSRSGYSGEQTIAPNELYLWRVLSIYEDGKIDIISEYLSSNAVFFGDSYSVYVSAATNYYGNPYRFFVGYLNEIVKQYETEGITVGSRHFGYDGQTEFILDGSKFIVSPPWTTNTTSNVNEKIGGGDILYQRDYDLVNDILGTTAASRVNSTTYTSSYWVASRYYYYGSSSWWGFSPRIINSSGTLTYEQYFYYYGTYNGRKKYICRDTSYSIRPIVTLKPGLKYSGEGTIDTPWTITS